MRKKRIISLALASLQSTNFYPEMLQAFFGDTNFHKLLPSEHSGDIEQYM